MSKFNYDAFICHASEDKEEVAIPLTSLLSSKGNRIWLDQMTIQIGDSIREKIDEGLTNSRYGIVIISPHFFSKNWTQYELDGFFAREFGNSAKVVLPVWHNVSVRDVERRYPALSMRRAINTTEGLEKIAEEIDSVLKSCATKSNLNAQSDIQKAKQAILTGSLEQNKFIIVPDRGQGGRTVQVAGIRYNGSENQRKLFLHAVDELLSQNLVEQIEPYGYELTYTGIQKAKQMEKLKHPESIGKD